MCPQFYYLLRWALILVLGLVIYYQAFRFDFVFDDAVFIVDNPYIKDWGRFGHLWNVFPMTRLVGMYSFAVNYALGGLNPLGYHIFNFLVHLSAVGLVWGIASMIFRIARAPFHRELPFMIALLFLVHPCQIQAVTYITQRFESLATLFYLGAFFCYLKFRLAPSRRQGALMLILAFASGILGLFTKEVVVTLPLTILAAELILKPGDKTLGKKARTWLWAGIAAAVLGFFFILARLVHAGPHMFSQTILSESHNGDIITFGNYVLTQMRVFLTFVRLLVLPVDQNLDHDYLLSTGLLHPPLTLVGILVIAAVIALIFRLRREQPVISFGLAWMLITFSINLAPRAFIIFEHKLYLISFGVFLAFIAALPVLFHRRAVWAGVFVCLIAVLSWVSFQRNQVWRNELTLWNDVVSKSPNKARPYNNRALAYFRHQNNAVKAVLDATKAIQLKPDYAEAYNNRGFFYTQQGVFAQAVLDHTKAIELKPDFIDAYYNRGIAYHHQGAFAQAIADYTMALAMKPNDDGCYNNRGLAYSKQGHWAEAAADYTRAIAIAPGNIRAYNNRAEAYRMMKEYDKARADVQKAEALAISGTRTK